MAGIRSIKLFSLLQREVLEYKVSFIWTPVVIALGLSLIMIASVLLANRITVMGDTMLQVIMAEEAGVGGPVITVNINDDDDKDVSAPADSGVNHSFQVETPDEPIAEEDWNFSREWRFEPEKREKSEYDREESVGSLNPLLNVMHYFMLGVLVMVTANYLLGCLYNDRKDRSILFWKSMPVSEWEEVLARLAMALVVVPAIYIALSLLLQMVFVLLAMLLLWRMEMDPFATVLGNIEFGSLLLHQVGGWIVTALWIAPAFAWLMLASAWAKRSPFMVAIAPVIGLMLLEGIVLGTDVVYSAVINHIPHYIGGESEVGFYVHGLFRGDFDYLSMISGLIFAAVAVAVAVYLRRYRFEI